MELFEQSFILEILKTHGLATLLVLYIIFYWIPRERAERKKERETEASTKKEETERMLSLFKDLMIKDVTVAFQGVNESIIGVYRIIEEQKKLNKLQVKIMMETYTDKVLYKMLNNLLIIVDNNNLVANAEIILGEIKNMGGSYINKSKETLEALGISEDCIDVIFKKIKAISERSFLEIAEVFTDTVSDLALIQSGFKNTELDYKHGALSEVQYERAMAKKEKEIRNDYSELSRKIRLIISETETKISEAISETVDREAQ